MKVWPHAVASYTQHEVKVYAVENQEWQEFRISLKGLSTEEKLDRLDNLRASKMDQKGEMPYERFLPRRWQVAIDNYVQALYRGGLVRPLALADSISKAGFFEVVR